jgi:hypothetical protein
MRSIDSFGNTEKCIKIFNIYPTFSFPQVSICKLRAEIFYFPRPSSYFANICPPLHGNSLQITMRCLSSRKILLWRRYGIQSNLRPDVHPEFEAQPLRRGYVASCARIADQAVRDFRFERFHSETRSHFPLFLWLHHTPDCIELSRCYEANIAWTFPGYGFLSS